MIGNILVISFALLVISGFCYLISKYYKTNAEIEANPDNDFNPGDMSKPDFLKYTGDTDTQDRLKLWGF